MIVFEKHRYKNLIIPEFEITERNVVSLFTPIFGLANKSFLTNNKKIHAQNLKFINLQRRLIKSKIDLPSPYLALFEKLKRNIQSGGGQSIDFILANFLVSLNSFPSYVFFTAGLSSVSIESLYQNIYQIITNFEDPKCAIIIENPTNKRKINTFNIVNVKDDVLSNFDLWYEKQSQYVSSDVT